MSNYNLNTYLTFIANTDTYYVDKYLDDEIYSVIVDIYNHTI